MKLAHLCPYDFFRHGGVQTHIRDLAASQAAGGHEVQIIAPGGGRDGDDARVHRFGRRFSLHFDQTENDISWALGREARRLQLYLEEQAFDLVHFHTPWDPALSWQVLRHFHGARVATFHNTLGDGFSGRLLQWGMQRAGPWFLGKFDALIAASQGPLGHLRPPPGMEIAVMPPVIGLRDYLEGERPVRAGGDPFEVLFVGRMDARKGVHVLLDAYAELLRQGDSGMRLTLAGGGGELQQVRQRVADEGWTGVRVLGPVSEQAKRGLLLGADVFCSPAMFGESFGLVLLEALAAGLPVVAAANPGYAGWLGAQAEHCLVPPGDAPALAQALTHMRQSPGLRAQLSGWGREVARGYDCTAWTDRIDALYRAAIDKAARRGDA